MKRPAFAELRPFRGLCAALAVATALALGLGVVEGRSAAPVQAASPARVEAERIPALPERLSQTGLYLSGTLAIDARNLILTPQYPLWSDGASKRRYLRLPDGAAIDASNPDGWVVPPGTRLWKELSFGRRVETRLIERLADGSYRYAAYVWNQAETDALLAAEDGVTGVVALADGVAHDIPARRDCVSCHEGRPNVVLGLSALQLSDQLPELVRRGLVRGLPAALLGTPPHIRGATRVERAALGYLYANCAGCHNATGPLAGLALDFDQSVQNAEGAERVRASTFGRPSRFRRDGAELRVAPGQPERSVVALRMRSRDPLVQMPPLGTHLADAQGVRLIEQWISEGR